MKRRQRLGPVYVRDLTERDVTGPEAERWLRHTFRDQGRKRVDRSELFAEAASLLRTGMSKRAAAEKLSKRRGYPSEPTIIKLLSSNAFKHFEFGNSEHS